MDKMDEYGKSFDRESLTISRCSVNSAALLSPALSGVASAQGNVPVWEIWGALGILRNKTGFKYQDHFARTTAAEQPLCL